MKIHPATCDKECERCPNFKNCNGVVLTDEQQKSVVICGYSILVGVILVVACFVLEAIK